MTTAELLTHLRNLNVTLSGDNGQLILRGPKGALTAELRTELKERKAEILDFLKTLLTANAVGLEPALRIEGEESSSFVRAAAVVVPGPVGTRERGL